MNESIVLQRTSLFFVFLLLFTEACEGCFYTSYGKLFALSFCKQSTLKYGLKNDLPQTESSRKNVCQLGMNPGGFGNFFNFNNSNNDRKEGDDDGEENNEDEDYAGCTNIFKIDAKSLKLGGCRLYLSLFFMGQTNTPEKGTWRMNQNGDGGLDLYFKDTTGALIVVFKENAILVNRLGSSPSMEYLIQESSMLNGMLDQLDEIAMDSSINESDRLLCIEGDQINIVRESLSFT